MSQNDRPPNDRALRVAFFGTPDFAIPSLKALLSDQRFEVTVVITQPDRPAGRGGELKASPIKKLALEHGVSLLQPGSIKKTMLQFLTDLQSFGPLDVAVVVAFGQILPIEVLKFPSGGSINVHASLLPRWRGAAPIQRALISGDKETGICLMQMEAGLDTGAVFARATIPITEQDNFGTLHDKLAQAGAELISKELVRFLSGEVRATPQPENGVTYANKITNDEARIDWSKSSAEISQIVRGMSPVPGAFSSIAGKRIKILAATAAAAINTQSTAGSQLGQIALVAPDTIEVTCGSGVLRIFELQLEGKKRMTVQEFLRGHPLAPGAIMGMQ